MQLTLFVFSVIVSAITIIGFAGYIARWCINSGIIKPLCNAIKALQNTIDDLKKAINKIQANQHEQDKRIGILEEQIKVVNHRVRDLEEVTRK